MDGSIYLLYGSETYLLEISLKKIMKQFGETVKGINYIVLEESNVESVLSEVRTPSFGYEKKLIVVKNANLFQKETKRKTKGSTNQELAQQMNDYLQENMDMVKESVVLIFQEQEVEKNNLYDTIKRYGIIQEFKPQTQAELASNLVNIAGKYQVKLDSGTAKYLVETCGTSMQDLINELRKQIEYARKKR